MPRSSERTRLARAAKLAISRAVLIDKLEEVQAKIANLTPLSYIKNKLLKGQVSSEWFIQRLLDSGYPLKDALDQFYIVRHGPGGDMVADVNVNDIPVNQSPLTRRLHSGGKASAAQPKLKDIRNVYAPHLVFKACSCGGTE